jgi:hypothetical protein
MIASVPKISAVQPPESDQPQKIWKPNLVFARIRTSCDKGGAIEQIVKASAVRRFFARSVWLSPLGCGLKPLSPRSKNAEGVVLATAE